MAEAQPFTHCEFGHLLTWQTARITEPPLTFAGHIHEDEAFACAQFEQHGWPRVDRQTTR